MIDGVETFCKQYVARGSYKECHGRAALSRPNQRWGRPIQLEADRVNGCTLSFCLLSLVSFAGMFNSLSHMTCVMIFVALLCTTDLHHRQDNGSLLVGRTQEQIIRQAQRIHTRRRETPALEGRRRAKRKRSSERRDGSASNGLC